MKKKNAFTLIELLVVIAIIALLLSITMPALRKAKEHAKKLVCATNLKQIGLAAHLYAQSNRDYIPRAEYEDPSSGDITTWQMYFLPYIEGYAMEDKWTDVGVYNCPSYPDKEQTVDYVVNAWNYEASEPDGGILSEAKKPTKMSNIRSIANYVYISDYEYTIDSSGDTVSPIYIVRADEDTDELWRKLRYMDVREKIALADSDESDRRVARNRHGNEGTNNCFFDGHVDWLNYQDNGMSKWRLKVR